MAMIDSEKLYRRIAGHSKYSGDAILTAISCLAEGKEIHDVPRLKNYVEVVRCENCDNYAPTESDKLGYCCVHDSIWFANDFCNHGRPREDND